MDSSAAPPDDAADIIEFQVADGTEYIDIRCADLPTTSPHELASVLHSERIALPLWLRVTLEYVRRGMPEAGIVMAARAVKEAKSPDEMKSRVRLALYLLHADLLVEQVQAEATRRQRAQHGAAASDAVEGGGSDAPSAVTSWEDYTRAVAVLNQIQSAFGPAATQTPIYGIIRAKMLVLAGKQVEAGATLRRALAAFQSSKDGADGFGGLTMHGDEMGRLMAWVDAHIKFDNGEYRAALDVYRRMLRDGEGSASTRARWGSGQDPRVGMALCLDRMGRPDLAVKCLRAAQARVSATSDRSDDDKTGAVLDGLLAAALMNCVRMEIHVDGHADASATMKEARELVTRGFRSNRSAPSTVLGLADILFYQGRIDDAQKLVGKWWTTLKDSGLTGTATRSTGSSSTGKEERGEAAYQLARIAHRKQDYPLALKYYKTAVQNLPEHLPAMYGLAQTLIAKGDVATATIELGRLRALDPKNVDTLLMLASCRHSQGTAESEQAALELFNKLFVMHSGEEGGAGKDSAFKPDAHMFAEFAEARVATQDLKDALRSFRVAEAFCTASSEDQVRQVLLPGIVHNIATLSLLHGDYDQAELGFHKVLDALWTPNADTTESEEPVRLNLLQASSLFNLGHVYEATNRRDMAKQAYRRVIRDHPGYTNVLLLDTETENHKKHHKEATDMLTAELKRQPSKTPVTTTYIKAWRAARDHSSDPKLARRVYEEIGRDAEHGAKEARAWCGAGRQILEEVRRERNAAGRPHLRVKAGEAFTMALKADPMCFVAANGLGVVLAELGSLKAAREMLANVRDAAFDASFVWVNYALVLNDLGAFHEASVAFEQAIKKFPSVARDHNVRLAAARAAFEHAKRTKSPEDMKVAVQQTEIAALLNPKDLASQYDMALVNFSYAQLYLAQPINQRTQEEIVKCIRVIDSSKKNFEFLVAQSGTDSELGFSKIYAEHRAKVAATEIQSAGKALREQQQYELEEIEQQRSMEAKRMEELERLEKEKELQNAKQDEQDEITRRLQREHWEREELERKREQELREQMAAADLSSEDDGHGGRRKRPRGAGANADVLPKFRKKMRKNQLVREDGARSGTESGTERSRAASTEADDDRVPQQSSRKSFKSTEFVVESDDDVSTAMPEESTLEKSA